MSTLESVLKVHASVSIGASSSSEARESEQPSTAIV